MYTVCVSNGVFISEISVGMAWLGGCTGHNWAYFCVVSPAKTQKEIEQIIAALPAKQKASDDSSSKPTPITVKGQLCAQYHNSKLEILHASIIT